MKCLKCHKNNPESASFCRHCGFALCNGSNEVSAELLEASGSEGSPHAMQARMRSKLVLPLTFVLVFALVLLLLGAVSMMHRPLGEEVVVEDVGPLENRLEIDFGDPIAPEDVDLDWPAAYYLSNSHVYSKIQTDTPSVLTASEVYDSMKERGFDGCVVTSSYSFDGVGTVYQNEEVVPDGSDEKHPDYEFIYVNHEGEVWLVSNINSLFTASPVSYNAESTQPELVFSERDYVMAFDGDRDNFYEIVPFEYLMTVKKVERIDADTLDKLTIERIKSL